MIAPSKTSYRYASIYHAAVLAFSLAIPAQAQGPCQQTIDSRSIPASRINDFTEHRYNAPAGPIGSFADCRVTRLFAAQIVGIRVTITSGHADDIGFVGGIQVTNTGNCNGVGVVSAGVDVTSQVQVSGNTATLLLRAQENCCCETGWGNAPGRGPARLHWEVVLDACGNDSVPPIISGAAVDRPVLWPPNHRMVPVQVNYAVQDNCSPASALHCTLSVASNEPTNGTGDGDTAPDWMIVDNNQVLLRAERAGTGSGRIYTITILCVDAKGNRSTRSVTVQVPKSQG